MTGGQQSPVNRLLLAIAFLGGVILVTAPVRGSACAVGLARALAAQHLRAVAAGAASPGYEAAPATTPVVQWTEGLRVNRAARLVEVDAAVCLRVGLLEQVACSPGTREHEAILVVTPKASDIHAALLLVGLEPGRPGRWSIRDETLILEPASGAPLDLRVRWMVDGASHEAPIASWIRGVGGSAAPTDAHWRFAGSVIVDERGRPAAEGRYVADTSGSIVGLVTFGDELMAWPETLPDREAVKPLEWEAYTERIPPEGTPVTILIRPAG